MDPLPEPTLPLNTDFGPYHLVKLIAVGGMAEIYLARTKGVAGFQKQLALKVIHPDYADDAHFVQMLVDEARLAVQLNHPNIAQTFDLGRIDDVYFISMEHVDGADYLKVLKGLGARDEDLPVPMALHVAHEVCKGLEYAHNAVDGHGQPLKITHRDISPQNILISRRGEVKLVDFGIAKAANVSRKTRAGVIKGKLVYMSPEQSWGESVDQRSDIFSAGIVLYEALTGGSLYLEKNPIKLLKLVRKAEIPPPSAQRPAVPVELDALVMKALQARPEDRYQSAQEFGQAIAQVVRNSGAGCTPAEVGALVAAVVDNTALPPGRSAKVRQRKRSGAGPMNRDDFAVHAHSVIFSAEEMMPSQPPGSVGAFRPAPGSGQRGERSATPPPAPSAAPSPPSQPNAGLRPAKARLVLMQDDRAETYELGEQFIIGRSGDLRLTNARVSRRHARIVFHDGEYLIEDLASSNGTFLNDQKVTQIRPLQPQDIVRIGPFEMRFVVERSSSPPLPPARASSPAPSPSPASAPSLLQRPAAGERAPAWVRNITPRLQAAQLAAAAAGEPVGEMDDRTLQHGQAQLVVRVGEERLVVVVDRDLALDHTLGLGEQRLGTVAGMLLRQDERFFLEPVSEREPVSLNGSALKHRIELHHGDVVDVGPIAARFEKK